MPHRVEMLSSAHDLRRFRCGKHPLDNYLKRHALANQQCGLGTPYVAVDAETGNVIGCVTLCASSVAFGDMPDTELPHYPIPALLIARLVVDRAAQGRGIGTDLVVCVLQAALGIAGSVGLDAVAVDAIDEAARRFYGRRFGFQGLLDDPSHLFVPLADLRLMGLSPIVPGEQGLGAS